MKDKKIIALAEEIVPLFSKDKLNNADEREKAKSFGQMLAKLLTDIQNRDAIYRLKLILSRTRNINNDFKDTDDAKFGIFYWVVTSATNVALALLQKEDEEVFLLDYSLQHNLRPIFQMIAHDQLRLNNLRKIMSDNVVLMDKLNSEKCNVDGTINALLKSGVLQKYQQDNTIIGLTSLGERLLQILNWIENFRGSNADFVIELLNKRALRISSL